MLKLIISQKEHIFLKMVKTRCSLYSDIKIYLSCEFEWNTFALP